MNKARLEAFSDGVLAILITIMVIELKVPHSTNWEAIKPVLLTLGSYVLSFVFIAIYWGNHHHLLQTAQKINGKIIWANMHLLFWLSLIPFATSWMGENNFDSVPVAVYGALLVLCGIAFTILVVLVQKSRQLPSDLAAIFQQTNMKGKISTLLYLSSIPLAFLHPLISCIIFIIVALMWIMPNKDVERILDE